VATTDVLSVAIVDVASGEHYTTLVNPRLSDPAAELTTGATRFHHALGLGLLLAVCLHRMMHARSVAAEGLSQALNAQTHSLCKHNHCCPSPHHTFPSTPTGLQEA
jgi:hypothetical protein